ncbi:tetratricopeptide repeat protein [Roseateles koreensis]|uniref:Tetratricopeptide repeat-containing protein n=1 Tax=Roseateles koreensis TaxID=2987526 RepID=A0ABT5KY44_9BURK|nr:tetratricopeptide repeat protein [Roseateles koreensis]MDC8787283.1 hypothetical protein [Roseateles koreensis]
MQAMTQAKSQAPMPVAAQAIQNEPLPNGLSVEAALLLAQARNMAFSEAAQGRIGSGLMVLQEALEFEPMSHDLLSDMAALLLSAGQMEHAQTAAERALAVQPDHGASLYTLAFALSGQGHVLRARETLQQLLSGAALESLQREAPDLLPVARNELGRINALLVDVGIGRAA